MHIMGCLETLIHVAAVSGRVAILPPPWLTLHMDHNYSPLHRATRVGDDANWARYFDLSDLVASGAIADPRGPSVHVPTAPADANNFIGATVPTGVAMRPDTHWAALAAHDARLAVLSFKPDWGAPRRRNTRTSSCHDPSVGGLNSITGTDGDRPAPPPEVKQKLPTFRPRPPSALVVRTAAAVAARLGRFTMLHIRRGRVVTGTGTDARAYVPGQADPDPEAGEYSHGGCGNNNLLKVTSPEFIAKTFQHAAEQRNTTVLVMTNEPRPAYHAALKRALPTARFDWELPEMRHVYVDLKDNYLAFQVLRHLSAHAVEAVGTASCYFAAACARMLCDGECFCGQKPRKRRPPRGEPATEDNNNLRGGSTTPAAIRRGWCSISGLACNATGTAACGETERDVCLLPGKGGGG